MVAYIGDMKNDKNFGNLQREKVSKDSRQETGREQVRNKAAKVSLFYAYKVIAYKSYYGSITLIVQSS